MGTMTRILLSVLSVHVLGSRGWATDAAGDYKTVASGNWNSPATWNYYDGSGWVAATVTPTSSDGVITIDHSVSVTHDVTVDQVVCNGALTVNSGATLIVADGLGTDFATGTSVVVTTDGTLNVNGTFVTGSASTMTVSAGGVVNISAGGILDLSVGGADPRLKVYGTINSSGAIVTYTNVNTIMITVYSGGVFSLAGAATIDLGCPSSLYGVEMTVRGGATLEIGPLAYVKGYGFLSVWDDANLTIGSADGIDGNVRSRQLIHNAVYYTFNGVAAQVTGDDFIMQPKMLTVDNPNGVTLIGQPMRIIRSALYLKNGNLALGTCNLSAAS